MIGHVAYTEPACNLDQNLEIEPDRVKGAEEEVGRENFRVEALEKVCREPGGRQSLIHQMKHEHSANL
jgi:hypothetical protein